MSNKLYPGETVTIVHTATLNGAAITPSDVDQVLLEIVNRDSPPTTVLNPTPMVWNAILERWEYLWATPSNYTGFYLAKVTADGVASEVNWEYKSILVSPQP